MAKKPPAERLGKAPRTKRPAHVSQEDLERYYLGQITQEKEIAALEKHLLACDPCVRRAQEAQDYVDAMRRAIIEGNYDLKTNRPPPRKD
jgi:hypothetical protein